MTVQKNKTAGGHVENIEIRCPNWPQDRQLDTFFFTFVLAVEPAGGGRDETGIGEVRFRVSGSDRRLPHPRTQPLTLG